MSIKISSIHVVSTTPVDSIPEELDGNSKTILNLDLNMSQNNLHVKMLKYVQ